MKPGRGAGQRAFLIRLRLHKEAVAMEDRCGAQPRVGCKLIAITALGFRVVKGLERHRDSQSPRGAGCMKGCRVQMLGKQAGDVGLCRREPKGVCTRHRCSQRARSKISPANDMLQPSSWDPHVLSRHPSKPPVHCSWSGSWGVRGTDGQVQWITITENRGTEHIVNPSKPRWKTDFGLGLGAHTYGSPF